ncbi:MAG: PhnA domain-containing protein [Minisyncoccia bacterium]
MNNEIIMYGADWCRDCVQAKAFLDERNITYTFLDITDPEMGEKYSQIVMDLNDGKRIIPTLVINDEHHANPRPSDLTNIIDNLDQDDDGITRCSLGKELSNGDTILLTRDLDVKGSSLNLKQGTAIEKIKLTGDPAYIDCKIGKSKIAIKTEFVKKKG